MSPATPAEALVCPIMDFTEPTAHQVPLRPEAEYTSARERISVASPTLVPVPWASTSSMVSGATCAMR